MLAALILGLAFPLINWMSFIYILVYRATGDKRSSAVLIPIVGPVLINAWAFSNDHQWWVYVLPWFLDIGTVYFVCSLPGFIKEEWGCSKFNSLMRLKSNSGIQNIELMLQKNGKYICRFRWIRKKGELGILSTNDFGTYRRLDASGYELVSHTGKLRMVEKVGEIFVCKDNEFEGDLNIDGFIFT